MDVTAVPAEVYVVMAGNGDPLLLYGEIEGTTVIWPLACLPHHALAFARWSRRNVSRWRGKRILLQHPMCERTRRWCEWLGCVITQNAQSPGEVVV